MPGRPAWRVGQPDGGRQQLLEEAAPSHVECVRRNFVDAVDPEDYAAVGRAMDAILGASQA